MSIKTPEFVLIYITKAVSLITNVLLMATLYIVL